MYEKDLGEGFRLRLSLIDMNFLRDLSSQRDVTVSECVRSIIGEYRRSYDASYRVTLPLNEEQYDWLIHVSSILGVLPSDYLRMCINCGIFFLKEKGAQLSNGDTKTDINHKL